jgi:Cof subfamily protein (haloacid dehalogenase superfamily)
VSPSLETISIRLVVSDVDGTLVDKNRRLTEAAIRAVKQLHDASIHFTISSARPPAGVREFISLLEITSPVSCLNGAQIVLPDLTPIRSIPIQPRDAETSAEVILRSGLDLWVFSDRGWFVSKLDGAHVAHESSLTGLKPEQLPPIQELDAAWLKAVGVSDDFQAVATCESDLQKRTDLHISASRSQKYYLDVTNMNANKGNSVLELSDILGIPVEQIATIGDMPTDVTMFRHSGLSIAMGNAADEVKAEATIVTLSNEQDGFAYAMDTFVLHRASPAARSKQ